MVKYLVDHGADVGVTDKEERQLWTTLPLRATPEVQIYRKGHVLAALSGVVFEHGTMRFADIRPRAIGRWSGRLHGGVHQFVTYLCLESVP